MGRNLTHPLKHPCANFREMQKFLLTCRWVDPRHREVGDYWQPPEEFEESRKGDCADFALWAWRQVLDMGIPARFVTGSAFKFGGGHAWVTFEKDGKSFLLEPQRRTIGLKLPRISTLTYHPETSVAWDGKKISYYIHEKRNTDPPISCLPALVWEWILIWGRFWIWALPRIPLALARTILGRSPSR
ncbi:MAG: transglutaminase domain-containing protein [Terriglobia bacterium]